MTDYYIEVRIGIEGMTKENPKPLLTPSEVASRFRVDPKTVTRWAKAGKLAVVMTLGGHRRYLASQVDELTTQRLEGSADPSADT